MRKGRLEVVFLNSGVFLGGGNSGKISPKNFCTYLHCDYLTYSISNNTHTVCCFYHILLQSSKYRPTSGSVQIEEMTDLTSNVAFVFTSQFFEKYVKNIETFIQIITRLLGEKLSRVEGSPSQPSQLYRAFV